MLPYLRYRLPGNHPNTMGVALRSTPRTVKRWFHRVLNRVFEGVQIRLLHRWLIRVILRMQYRVELRTSTRGLNTVLVSTSMPVFLHVLTRVLICDLTCVLVRCY
uniref:Uncharacterized protein n=1 Tax=Rhodococcoides fascians D188 TaxID=1051973 RepID=G8JYM9_RHOFA|nr:hypothetical protein pFi_014 [Rhodococcus fascians D188]